MPSHNKMLPKLKRTIASRNIRDYYDRRAKRRRTGSNRATPTTRIPSFPVKPLPKGIVLAPSRQYSVEIEGLGQMSYKDGWFRADGRPRTDLGLQDGRFITNAKVIIRNAEGINIFSGGGSDGGSNQVISLQMNKNTDESKTLAVSLVQDSGNKVYRFPTPSLEMTVGHNETVNVYGLRNVTITAGNGGHVVHNGIGYVLVKGKVQSVTSHGAGMIRVEGNVDEGMSIGGTTKVTIAGDVSGDIRANGLCFLHVFGRHLGTGKVYKAWLAKVEISEEDWGRGDEEGVEDHADADDKKEKETKGQFPQTQNQVVEKNKEVKEKPDEDKENNNDYDDLEEIKMDIISDDEDPKLDYYS